MIAKSAESIIIDRLDLAYAAWQKALGKEYVDMQEQSLERFLNATFHTSQEVLAVLRPANTKEVQECVKIANQFGVKLYPISTGKNWGNGSAVPITDNCVLLHLERLNKISNLNKKQAYVTIEPGVTQGQLSDYLKEQNSGLWVDITGASPDTSLIGNIMERGAGHSAYSNRISQICNLEVVLPTGELIETGFGKFQNANSKEVHPFGLGPALDGLFSESNLGIVTRLTLWLMPIPEKVECYYFTVRGEDKLQEVIDALQPLRLNRVLQSAVHIGNDYKVLNTYFQYPWQLTKGQTPLASELLSEFKKSVGCEDWSGSGALYGTANQIKETKRLLKKALKGKVQKLSFMSDWQLSIAKKFPTLIGKLLRMNLKFMLPTIESIYGMQKGVPSKLPMFSAYWRKKFVPKDFQDPDKDRCGLIWYSPMAPLDGGHAQNMYHITKRILLAYGFEPLIAFAFMSERALCGVVALVYDRSILGEDQKAMKCHYELIDALAQAGYYPYRLGVQNMHKITHTHAKYQEVINQLKNSLDPNGILAPGRYEF